MLPMPSSHPSRHRLPDTRAGLAPFSYDRFTFDITDFLNTDGTTNELLVRVYDPSDHGAQVFGKQRVSAIESPGGDTYTPNSGIWQTVWFESVPLDYITAVRITPDLTGINVTVNTTATAHVRLTVFDGQTKVGIACGVRRATTDAPVRRAAGAVQRRRAALRSSQQRPSNFLCPAPSRRLPLATARPFPPCESTCQTQSSGRPRRPFSTT